MVRKICNILSTMVLVVLAVTAALLLLPRILGYHTLAVLSGSMEPEISVGEIVYIKNVDEEELQVGDIVTYMINGNTMVTHRITGIDRENQLLITKGDANDSADSSPVTYGQVVGKLFFHVPYLGYISIYMRTSLGIAVICGVVFIVLILNLLPELFSKEKKEVNEDADH